MTQHVRDIMTSRLVTVEPQASVTAVAQKMRDEDIGIVLVTEGDDLRGLVSDRDLVVRALAEGGDPDERTVASACSDDLVTVTPDEDLDHAVELMREHSVRRLPVVEEGHAVGIISIGGPCDRTRCTLGTRRHQRRQAQPVGHPVQRGERPQLPGAYLPRVKPGPGPATGPWLRERWHPGMAGCSRTWCSRRWKKGLGTCRPHRHRHQGAAPTATAPSLWPQRTAPTASSSTARPPNTCLPDHQPQLRPHPRRGVGRPPGARSPR